MRRRFALKMRWRRSSSNWRTKETLGTRNSLEGLFAISHREKCKLSESSLKHIKIFIEVLALSKLASFKFLVPIPTTLQTQWRLAPTRYFAGQALLKTKSWWTTAIFNHSWQQCWCAKWRSHKPQAISPKIMQIKIPSPYINKSFKDLQF